MVEPQRKWKTKYPKYDKTTLLNWFKNHFVPGRYITIAEYLHEYDGDYINERINVSEIKIRVVSVTPPQYRSGFFNIGGRMHWEDANAIVALPNGKTFPLFVHNTTRSDPYFGFNDIVYQELKKGRYVDVADRLSCVTNLFVEIKYDLFRSF